MIDDNKLEWSALTTGGFGGFDAWLEEGNSGELSIATNLVNETIRIEDIGFNDIVFENGGIDRRIRIFRLPDENTTNSVSISREITLNKNQDNPLYVRVTQEDGHYVWSSPIYMIDKG